MLVLHGPPAYKSLLYRTQPWGKSVKQPGTPVVSLNAKWHVSRCVVAVVKHDVHTSSGSPGSVIFIGLIGSNMIKANQNVYKIYKCLQYHDHLVIILILSYAFIPCKKCAWSILKSSGLVGLFMVVLWGHFDVAVLNGFDACESDASSWHLKQHVRAWTASTAFEGSHVWSRLVLVSGNVWTCLEMSGNEYQRSLIGN